MVVDIQLVTDNDIQLVVDNNIRMVVDIQLVADNHIQLVVDIHSHTQIVVTQRITLTPQRKDLVIWERMSSHTKFQGRPEPDIIEKIMNS